MGETEAPRKRGKKCKRVKQSSDGVLVRFNCTKEESADIDKRAAEAGLPKPEYVRRLCACSDTGKPIVVSGRTYEVLMDAARRYNMSIDGLLSTIAMKMQEFLRNFLRTG